MSPSICSVEGCEKAVKARGWCPMHDWRWRQHGDVTVCTTNRYVPMIDRFWMKVQKGPGCWNWTASTRGGYGRFTAHRGGKTHLAHRFAYELVVGPIPEGKLLDHTCHNRQCVNPSHLRPVNPKQNRENLGGLQKNNTTGARGVSFNKRNKLYTAFAGHNREAVYGGSFRTVEEAAEAARQLRLSLYTHNDLDRKTA